MNRICPCQALNKYLGIPVPSKIMAPIKTLLSYRFILNTIYQLNNKSFQFSLTDVDLLIGHNTTEDHKGPAESQGRAGSTVI